MIVPKNDGRNLLNKNERKNRINEMFKRNRIERRFKNMKEEKTKKKFNKKLLTFGILGIFALAVVSAGLMSYYGQIQAEVNVEQPISLEWKDTSDPNPVLHTWVDFTGESFIEDELGVVMAGDCVNGRTIRISNSADTERVVAMTNIDSSGGISVWEKDITVSAGGSATVKPLYCVDSMLESGDYTAKIQFLPLTA